MAIESGKYDGEVVLDYLPFFRMYKDGRVQRFSGTDVVPPSMDSNASVSSKDVIIEPETGVSARLYKPNTANSHQKLPLLIYFHGGGFLIESASSPTYHNHLNLLVPQANVVVVSVEYRRAPEHPVPIAYEDSWTAIKWVGSHAKGEGSEPWLKDFADFDRVFFGGDSAGANIAHNMAMKSNLRDEIKLLGMLAVNPYFWGKERIGSEESADPEKRTMIDKMWPYACPFSTLGNDDPRINPFVVGAPSLSGLGCPKVLVFVAGADVFRDRGWLYYESLKKSGWGGKVEILEIEGEDHVFVRSTQLSRITHIHAACPTGLCEHCGQIGCGQIISPEAEGHKRERKKTSR